MDSWSRRRKGADASLVDQAGIRLREFWRRQRRHTRKLPAGSPAPQRLSSDRRRHHHVSQNIQTVKMGLNLKLGEDLHAQWEPSASDYRLRGTSDAAYVR